MNQGINQQIVTALENEYLRRVKKNPSYSLRSFARSLEINSGTLSAILKRKRSVPRKMVSHLCLKMGIRQPPLSQSFQEKREFLIMGENDLGHRPVNWFEDIILETTQLEEFDGSEQWIAKKIGLTLPMVAGIVRQLLKEGRLQKDSNGALSKDVQSYDWQLMCTAVEMQRLQEETLEHSTRALWNVPLEARYHSSMTMAIAVKDLPRAKEMLRKFRQEFCIELERGEEASEVYQLALSFFPVSKLEKNGPPDF